MKQDLYQDTTAVTQKAEEYNKSLPNYQERMALFMDDNHKLSNSLSEMNKLESKNSQQSSSHNNHFNDDIGDVYDNAELAR